MCVCVCVCVFFLIKEDRLDQIKFKIKSNKDGRDF